MVIVESEVEAAWRAEFQRVGEAQSRDPLNGCTTEEPKRQKSWWGDEAEARRLRDEHTYHYVRWPSSPLLRSNRQPHRDWLNVLALIPDKKGLCFGASELP